MINKKQKLHFLVCEFHTEDVENKKLFNKFLKEVLTAEWQQKIFKGGSGYVLRNSTFLGKRHREARVKTPVKCEEYLSDEIKDAQVTTPVKCEEDESDEIEDAVKFGKPVFILQPVPMHGHVFRMMFDTGCENFVCRKAAIDLLPEDCKENIIKGPLNITGVGGSLVTSPYGH